MALMVSSKAMPDCEQLVATKRDVLVRAISQGFQNLATIYDMS
jgi:hypothetical protein